MHPSQSYPRRPFSEEYPSRFSDSRIFLLPAPSHPSTSLQLSSMPDLAPKAHGEVSGQWLYAGFVPDYSGGSAPDFPTHAGLRGSLHLDITF
jgi:hypothetical protein